MTEEKENCKFQQNYNVFGLDDKPCCYLYHKYCNEIDSCYFKRCKRLEQENNSLQAQLNNITVQTNNAITALEQENKELKTKLDVFAFTISQYESVLEEIRIMATKDVSIESFLKIQNKINEVLR